MNFLQIPYIPRFYVGTVLIDYRTPIDIIKSLQKNNIEIIKTIPCMELYEAINGHPDIIMHQISDKLIVLAPNIFDNFAPVLIKKGFALTKGETWLTRKYPGNIAYNVLRIGKYAFHNTKYTDREIMKEYEKNNIKVIHINQGYTKCSVCILDDKTIITSDLKISKISEKYGIDSLLVKPGGIVLENLNYGFIGGASGLISNRCIAFTGHLEYIEDKQKIFKFLENKGFEVKILGQRQIIDIGSIIPLTY